MEAAAEVPVLVPLYTKFSRLGLPSMVSPLIEWVTRTAAQLSPPFSLMW